MALAPFFTQRFDCFHCWKPLASAVPERNISVRLVKDHWALGVSGAGKLAMATASGISPDLNFSTMMFSALLTLSFMGSTSLKCKRLFGYRKSLLRECGFAVLRFCGPILSGYMSPALSIGMRFPGPAVASADSVDS